MRDLPSLVPSASTVESRTLSGLYAQPGGGRGCRWRQSKSNTRWSVDRQISQGTSKEWGIRKRQQRRRECVCVHPPRKAGGTRRNAPKEVCVSVTVVNSPALVCASHTPTSASIATASVVHAASLALETITYKVGNPRCPPATWYRYLRRYGSK